MGENPVDCNAFVNVAKRTITIFGNEFLAQLFVQYLTDAYFQVAILTIFG